MRRAALTTSSSTHHFRVLALLLGAALAASLLALVAGTKPVAAAFPGTPNAIAFVKYRSNAQVFRMGSDGFGSTPIAEAGERSLHPAWSSDGKKIAFTSVAHTMIHNR